MQHNTQRQQNWEQEQPLAAAAALDAQRRAVQLFLVQSPPPLARVDHPATWAAMALRASLGLVGTILTALSLWSITPPPL